MEDKFVYLLKLSSNSFQSSRHQEAHGAGFHETVGINGQKKIGTYIVDNIFEPHFTLAFTEDTCFV